MKEIGATPVSMVMSEVPSAMQKGVIDAAITGSLGAYDSKWSDVIDWGFILPVAGSGAFMIANQEALEELPSDVYDTLTEVAEKWEEKGNEEMAEKDEESIDNIESEGVEINRGSEEDIKKGKELMEDFCDKWAKEDNLKEELDEIKNATK